MAMRDALGGMMDRTVHSDTPAGVRAEEYPHGIVKGPVATKGAMPQEVINQQGVGEYCHCGFCQARDHYIEDCPMRSKSQGEAKRWKPGGGTWARENAGVPGNTYSDGSPDEDPVKTREGDM